MHVNALATIPATVLGKPIPLIPALVGVKANLGLQTRGWYGMRWLPSGKTEAERLHTLRAPLACAEPQLILLAVDVFATGTDPELRDLVFGAMAAARQHHYIVMTAHPDRAAVYVQDVDRRKLGWCKEYYILGIADYGAYQSRWPLPHVWFGTYARTQAEAAERVPQLYGIPAPLHVLNLIGQTEPIDLRQVPDSAGSAHPDGPHCLCPLAGEIGPGWIITGGAEAPPRTRWIEDIHDVASAYGPPVYFAGWGKTGAPHPDDTADALAVATIEDLQETPDLWREPHHDE